MGQIRLDFQIQRGKFETKKMSTVVICYGHSIFVHNYIEGQSHILNSQNYLQERKVVESHKSLYPETASVKEDIIKKTSF